MSDCLMDMHQRHTAPAAHASQRKSKHNNEINGYGDDIYSGLGAPETVCSFQGSGTTADTPPFDADIDDDFANVLSLKLRKPKHWRWELSTSRSCSHIALPRILLYDQNGQLLVDANSQVEQCYSESQKDTPQRETRRKSTSILTDTQQRPRKRIKKAVTTNLAHSIKNALDRQFNGLQIQEATPSPVPSHNCSTETTPTIEQTSTLSSAIDFYTNELPDYKKQRRANSLKGVRFKVNNNAQVDIDFDANKIIHNSFNLADLPTPPSTITTTTTPTNSSSSGTREKRRYRRSHSSGRSPAASESILERFSFNKGRFSSPEYIEEHEVYHAPRYFLRTSKAGTLVVQEESFSRYRRRRRPRNSSTENIQSGTGSGSKSSLKMSESGTQRQLKAHTTNGKPEERSYDSLLNVTELQSQVERRKVLPVRRYRSDCNVLVYPKASSSDEEKDREQEYDHARARVPQRAQFSPRKYANERRQSKRELIIIDPENGMQPNAVFAESR